MAYDDNQLFSQGSYDPYPRIKPVHQYPKTFAAGTDKLEVGTPVAFNTSTKQWVVWTSGGANGTGEIRGFVYPEAIQLVSGKEVLGVVMMAGEIHYDDIVLPSGETESDLKDSLRADAVRERGLWITGLDEVR
ncbi:MAG: hypothetical protein DRH24_14890 [Deltaproteobacteria bacterium]|nr:MAG: hypothetical protein DRH24_14890 [Deltaproteobacteria bacterium]